MPRGPGAPNKAAPGSSPQTEKRRSRERSPAVASQGAPKRSERRSPKARNGAPQNLKRALDNVVRQPAGRGPRKALDVPPELVTGGRLPEKSPSDRGDAAGKDTSAETARSAGNGSRDDRGNASRDDRGEGGRGPAVPPAKRAPPAKLEPMMKEMKMVEIFEKQDKSHEALVKTLKQACARNKAMERKEMWDQKAKEDKGGNANTIVLKSNDGDVKKVMARVPQGADVTNSSVNKYEEERLRNTSAKEDQQLTRFCDGKDNAWRPDFFFTEACGEEDLPPWPVRPTEIFTNPHLCMRIMAKSIEEKKKRKAEKKKDKKTKKDKKKEKKKKDKKKKKEKKKKESSSSSSSSSSS